MRGVLFILLLLGMLVAGYFIYHDYGEMISEESGEFIMEPMKKGDEAVEALEKFRDKLQRDVDESILK